MYVSRILIFMISATCFFVCLSFESVDVKLCEFLLHIPSWTYSSCTVARLNCLQPLIVHCLCPSDRRIIGPQRFHETLRQRALFLDFTAENRLLAMTVVWVSADIYTCLLNNSPFFLFYLPSPSYSPSQALEIIYIPFRIKVLCPSFSIF
jgi:hypothetical protein